MAKARPFADPCVRMDPTAYDEQLGWNLQVGGSTGETTSW